jgi:membrane protease YdiL (CAAX protease family)
LLGSAARRAPSADHPLLSSFANDLDQHHVRDDIERTEPTAIGPRQGARMSQRIDRSMRVPPRPLIGIVIWAAYTIYAVVSVLPSGIDADELADTTSNVIKGIVIPLGLGAAALLAAVYFMGWWRPVFHEERRSPRWTLLIAALLGLGVVVALLRTDWAGTEGSLILWLAVGTLCIAVAEETLCRGILVTALRGGVGEVGVWFWSSLLFGLLHAATIVLGHDVGPTLAQVGTSFLYGSVMYGVRRSTGTLVEPIIIHWLWDFASDVGDKGDGGPLMVIQGALPMLALVVFAVAALKGSIFRSEGAEESTTT